MDFGKIGLAMNKEHSAQERMALYSKAYDYYRGEHEEHLVDFLKYSRYSGNTLRYYHWDSMADSLYCENVIKKIVEARSQIYNEAPERDITASESVIDYLLDHYERMSFDTIMHELDRMCNLMQTVVLFLDYDFENDLFKPKILMPSNLNVVYNINTEPIAFYWEIFKPDSSLPDGRYFEYWSAEEHFLYTTSKYDSTFYGSIEVDNILDDESNPEHKNPYGFLPMVPIFNYSPATSSEFFLPGTGQLINFQEVLNEQLTAFNRGFKYGVVQFLVGRNIQNVTIEADPSKVSVINSAAGDPKEPSIEFVGMDMSKIQQAWQIIQDQIIHISSLYNIPPSAWRLTGDAPSGLALKIENRFLDRDIQERKKYFRFYEKQIFEKMCGILRTHGKLGKENIEFNIDFADQHYIEDPAIELEYKWKLVEKGLLPITDLYKEINPDIDTEEEALKEIQKNKDMLKKFESKGLSIFERLQEKFKNGEANENNPKQGLPINPAPESGGDV